MGAKLERNCDPNRSKMKLQLQRRFESVLGASWPPKLSNMNLTRHGTGSAVLLLRISFCSDTFCCFALCFLVFCNFSLCLADALLASPALRSRRSLRSLARCARPTILKPSLFVLWAFWDENWTENPSKIFPNRLQNPSKIGSKSISGASWLPSSIFLRFWSPPGRLLARLGASWAPSWKQVGLQKATNNQPKSVQKSSKT